MPRTINYTQSAVNLTWTDSYSALNSSNITSAEGKVMTVNTGALHWSSDYYNKTEVDTLMNTEVTNRTNADTTLQTNIDNEATTRSAADTGLQVNIDTLSGTCIKNNTTSDQTIISNLTCTKNVTMPGLYCDGTSQAKSVFGAMTTFHTPVRIENTNLDVTTGLYVDGGNGDTYLFGNNVTVVNKLNGRSGASCFLVSEVIESGTGTGAIVTTNASTNKRLFGINVWINGLSNTTFSYDPATDLLTFYVPSSQPWVVRALGVFKS